MLSELKLNEILKKENVYIDTNFKTKDEIINFIANELETKGFIKCKETFYQAVLDREAHSTTGIGNSIAIPHGKSDTVKDSTVFVLKNKYPIEWEALDDQPVNIVFCLAIADSDKTDLHLKLLSILAQKLMDDQVIEELYKVDDEVKLVNIFN